MSKQRDVIRDMFITSISEYSEDMWCAGWMSGIEEDIRNGNEQFLVMAYLADGWPQGYRGEDGWESLTDDERRQAREVLGYD